jgi:hypothetical protein
MLVGFGPIVTFQLLSLLRPGQSNGPAAAGLSNVGLVVGLIGELALFAAVLLRDFVADEPRALPWAGMNDAVGVRGIETPPEHFMLIGKVREVAEK